METRGESYRIVWREDGKKQSETLATLDDAERFKKLVEGSGNRWPVGWVKGVGIPALPIMAPGPAIPTFAEWATRTITARSGANGRSRADYLRDLRLHINPTFGKLPLNAITAEEVGAWLIELREIRSAKTVANLHALASSVMNDAIAAGRFGIGVNPFKGRAGKIATVRTEEMVFLTRPELDVVLAAMRETITVQRERTDGEFYEVKLPAQPHYLPFTTFLALTGLRWSEATALTIGDVTLFGKRRTVTVNKAWKRQPDGTFKLGEPKSRRSRRTIVLPDEAVELLIPAVASRGHDARLFVSPMGRTLHHGNFRNRIWLPALEKAACAFGFRKSPRIHDLRHSHASWLIEGGADLVSIQRRLGHESIQTTIDRYGHLTSESDVKINTALARTAAPPPGAAVELVS